MSSYYTIDDGAKEQFYKFPKIFMVEDSKYFSMSPMAKLTYSILADRNSLSIKNKWVDENKRVYFLFKQTEIAKFIGIKDLKTVRKYLTELEKYGLLERKRQGINIPDRMYLKHVDVTESQLYQLMGENSLLDEENSPIGQGKIPYPDEENSPSNNNNINNNNINKNNYNKYNKTVCTQYKETEKTVENKGFTQIPQNETPQNKDSNNNNINNNNINNNVIDFPTKENEIISYLNKKGFSNISTIVSDMKMLLENHSLEDIKEAIDITVSKDIHSDKYVLTILGSWRKHGKPKEKKTNKVALNDIDL